MAYYPGVRPGRGGKGKRLSLSIFSLASTISEVNKTNRNFMHCKVGINL